MRVANGCTPTATGQIDGSGLFGMGTGGLSAPGLGFGHIVPPAGCANPSPRCSTDYIFAAFGTEMGLLGTTVIVFAFVLLVGAGLRIAQTARSEFAKMVAAGLTVIIGHAGLLHHGRASCACSP